MRPVHTHLASTGNFILAGQTRMSARRTITRKEIAQAAEISVDTVARREREWGLHRCRSRANGRPILYFRKKANHALLSRRLIEEPL